MGNQTTVATFGVWGVFVLIALNALEFYQADFYAAVIAGYEEMLALAVTAILSFFLPNIGQIGRTAVGGGQRGYLDQSLLYFLSALSVLLLVVACAGAGNNPNRVKMWTSDQIVLLSDNIDAAHHLHGWIDSETELSWQRRLQKANRLLLPGALPDPELCPDDATAAQCRLTILNAVERLYLEAKDEGSGSGDG